MAYNKPWSCTTVHCGQVLRHEIPLGGTLRWACHCLRIGRMHTSRKRDMQRIAAMR